MIWLTNPRFLIPSDCLQVVDLFYTAIDEEAFANGASGFSAMKFLPDPGGENDQAACLYDAFIIIGQVARGLKKK